MKDYLLLTTVGKSNHWKNWIQSNRNYDIGICYYENDDNFLHIKNEVDYFWHKPGFKYPSLYNIIIENKKLLEYKYIWMPDDDIIVNIGTINELFEIANNLQLDLFQPSIIAKNYTWPITLHQKNSDFRFVSMVEIMCPGFSGPTLKKVIKSFNESYSGWGLEWAWVNLSGERRNKTAVIDSIIIEHVKNIQLNGGRLYQKLKNDHGLTPHQEMNKLIKKYKINNKIFSNI